MLAAFDQKIRQAFSSAAMQYDALSSLHRAIGRELFKDITLYVASLETYPDVFTVLDVGMGTGWFTQRLMTQLPGARVIGLDAALGMIQEARRKRGLLNCVQADARALPFLKETFHLLSANLSFQWVSNLNEGLASCHRVMRSQGALFMTVFGGKTFKELFEALEATRVKESLPLNIQRFASGEAIRAALQQEGFNSISVSSEYLQTHFASMRDLLTWIKQIGANALPRQGYVGKQWLERAGAYYQEHYRTHLGVTTSFEVITLKAQKLAKITDS